MFMIQDSVYQLGKTALDATNLRHQVISHNISNVNTKDFKTKEVNFEGELKKALDTSSVNLRATDVRHFGVSNTYSVTPEVTESSDSTKMNLDGNNVDIDYEMTNMAANQIQYNALIRQVNEKISNYHYVIRGN